MRRPLLILIILFTSLSNTSIGCTCSNENETEFAHDFHYSRLEMNWNSLENTWQGILRVFTDDLERALSAHQASTKIWKLGDAEEHPDADQGIKDLLKRCMVWTTDGNSSSNEWRFIGKEVDFDLTYLYFESTPVDWPETLTISNRLFFQEFQDQVNEVTINFGQASFRHWITNEEPQVEFQLKER